MFALRLYLFTFFRFLRRLGGSGPRSADFLLTGDLRDRVHFLALDARIASICSRIMAAFFAADFAFALALRGVGTLTGLLVCRLYASISCCMKAAHSVKSVIFPFAGKGADRSATRVKETSLIGAVGAAVGPSNLKSRGWSLTSYAIVLKRQKSSSRWKMIRAPLSLTLITGRGVPTLEQS
jgi:hypothetical protein